ncbi:MAG: AIR synthase-related protein, partial [Defluviitaleaceae bacterium]|nr:AIR synthase-related protein [Defluviitaleaceae bacterium]
EVLLTPTKIYVKPIFHAMKHATIKGMAHITGGGFIENIPRMLPKGLAAHINQGTWEVPEVFAFLQDHGKLNRDEMYNIFNMGIGMVVAVAPADAKVLIDALAVAGEKSFAIGTVQKATESSNVSNFLLNK